MKPASKYFAGAAPDDYPPEVPVKPVPAVAAAPIRPTPGMPAPLPETQSASEFLALQSSKPHRKRGVIQGFNLQKGFGFLTPDGLESSHENDLFIHISHINNRGTKITPRRGVQVEFSIGKSRDGRPMAIDVELL